MVRNDKTHFQIIEIVFQLKILIHNESEGLVGWGLDGPRALLGRVEVIGGVARSLDLPIQVCVQHHSAACDNKAVISGTVM